MKILLSILLFLIFFHPLAASAQFFPLPASNDSDLREYQPLEPFPNVDQSGSDGSFKSVLQFAFRILFTIGGLIAVFTLILGGIAYMISEAVNKKDEARRRIQAAIWGLLLLIISWLILYTINPELLNFNFIIKDMGTVPTAVSSAGSGPGWSARQFASQELEGIRERYGCGTSIITLFGGEGGCVYNKILIWEAARESTEEVHKAILLYERECRGSSWSQLFYANFKVKRLDPSVIGLDNDTTRVVWCVNPSARGLF